jgi:hypothetical protein
MLLFTLLTTSLLSLVAADDEDQCYAQKKAPYIMFSTFTRYEFVYGKSTTYQVYIPPRVFFSPLSLKLHKISLVGMCYFADSDACFSLFKPEHNSVTFSFICM